MAVLPLVFNVKYSEMLIGYVRVFVYVVLKLLLAEIEFQISPVKPNPNLVQFPFACK